MRRSGIITLLTDFGDRDPFVGVMRGVILSRFPEARIVDLVHQIPPQRVRAGAFWLERAHRWFPEGTVHVAVIDPGVGTERRIVGASADGHLFLAPDNGLLGPVLENSQKTRVVLLDLERLSALGIDPPSATFHGRDIFAPLAAEMAAQRLRLRALGPVIETDALVPSALPRPIEKKDRVEGEVVVVDRFGNLITNIPGENVGPKAAVEIRGKQIPLARTYGDVAAGAYLALVSSFDRLEIARAEGSAAEGLAATVGERVVVTSPVLRDAHS
jgi:S-adenosylmethionine hydrolase